MFCQVKHLEEHLLGFSSMSAQEGIGFYILGKVITEAELYSDWGRVALLENITGVHLLPISSDPVSSMKHIYIYIYCCPFVGTNILLFRIETMDNALFS